MSGYLYSQQAEGQEQATHVWVDVFVLGSGWIALALRHNMPQTANEVRVAAGRDYADVTPMHGIYTGKATEMLSVSVHVRTSSRGRSEVRKA